MDQITRRFLAPLLCAVALVYLTFLAGAPVQAADYKGPRTSWGAPDLEGYWNNSSLTRLERPAEAKALTLSESETVVVELKLVELAARTAVEGVGQQASEWYDRAVHLARIDGQVRTSWIVDPVDGKTPYTREGRKLFLAGRASMTSGFDNPEARPAPERCLMASSASSGPPLLNAPYASSYQIVQTRDHVVILSEMIHDARIIQLNAKHLASNVQPWMGQSVGHWENDTLVVETAHFNPGEVFRVWYEISPGAKVVERFTRVSPDQILYQFQVEDPSLFTQVWRGEMPLLAVKGPLYEYACHEGNYSLGGILAGARRQEADNAAKSKAAQ